MQFRSSPFIKILSLWSRTITKTYLDKFTEYLHPGFRGAFCTSKATQFDQKCSKRCYYSVKLGFQVIAAESFNLFYFVCLPSLTNHRKPPTYKSVIQANGSAKKKHKEEKPPDLWINHTENLEMKPVQAVNPAPDVTNTSTIPR